MERDNYTPETTAKELFSTPKDFLKIKKAPNHNFYYTERKGIDSVSIVLIDKVSRKIGLTMESKPPFSERENVPLAFKLTALGGSLFDMVGTEEYLKMSFEDQLEVATKTAIKEVQEEAGYECVKIHFCGRVVFNSMSNEYVYLFLAEVDASEDAKPDPQNHLESLAKIEWVDIEEGSVIECGKTLATLMNMAILDIDII
jgi:8-oxo-dGTP pyrophosphatase MutT (NUDIX family)